MPLCDVNDVINERSTSFHLPNLVLRSFSKPLSYINRIDGCSGALEYLKRKIDFGKKHQHFDERTYAAV